MLRLCVCRLSVQLPRTNGSDNCCDNCCCCLGVRVLECRLTSTVLFASRNAVHYGSSNSTTPTSRILQTPAKLSPRQLDAWHGRKSKPLYTVSYNFVEDTTPSKCSPICAGLCRWSQHLAHDSSMRTHIRSCRTLIIDLDHESHTELRNHILIKISWIHHLQLTDE